VRMPFRRQPEPPAPRLELTSAAGHPVLSLDAAVAEQYRRLHTALWLDGGPVVLALTSAIRGEGVTEATLGLGAVLAHDLAGRFVVAELNLAAPALAQRFALAPAPGLAECLRGEAALDTALRPTSLANLWLLPGGDPGPASDVTRLVRGEALREQVAQLRAQFDRVVLDLPAVLSTSDAVALARLADAVALAVRAGVTPLALCRQAAAMLGPDRLAGAVLVGQRLATPAFLRRLLAAD